MRRCVQTLTGSVPGNAEHSLVSGAYKSQDWCQAGWPLGSMTPTPVLSSSPRALGFTTVVFHYIALQVPKGNKTSTTKEP